MSLRQHLKFRDLESFPSDTHPATTDYFITLNRQLQEGRRIKTLVSVVGLYPIKEPQYKMEALSFFTFSTNKTAYAALSDMEDAFADFYLRTGILPNINPLPYRYFKEPEKLSSGVRTLLSRKGAFIYGAEE